MKTHKTLMIALIACASLSPLVRAQSGGPFQLKWSTIDSGGGTSTGSVFSVSGTIGQPDAGPRMTGASFTVQGGFWSLFDVIQTEGAPRLRIRRSGAGGVVVSWAAPATGWVLQQTDVLTSDPRLTVWSPPSAHLPPLPPVVIVDGENTVTINPATGIRYFRLQRP